MDGLWVNFSEWISRYQRIYKLVGSFDDATSVKKLRAILSQVQVDQVSRLVEETEQQLAEHKAQLSSDDFLTIKAAIKDLKRMQADKDILDTIQDALEEFQKQTETLAKAIYEQQGTRLVGETEQQLAEHDEVPAPLPAQREKDKQVGGTLLGETSGVADSTGVTEENGGKK